MSPQLRTVKQAAAELTISPLTLRSWIHRGQVGVTRIGRCVRIPESEIQRLIDRGFVPALVREVQ